MLAPLSLDYDFVRGLWSAVVSRLVLRLVDAVSFMVVPMLTLHASFTVSAFPVYWCLQVERQDIAAAIESDFGVS
jgi:hypothetical protein